MGHRADWFQKAKWGVFIHYLAPDDMSAKEWNERVDGFDVEGLAGQLEATGARYFFITLGQNSGHYCAPNAFYDSVVGIKPSKCSRRDLVEDLYAALAPRGIELLVYLPSGAPDRDAIACQKLGWRWGFTDGWGSPTTGDRLVDFQLRWEQVISEWSMRWGTKVKGWWFDGCYFADDMYCFTDSPNFASFAAAARAGNPDSIVAFNPGVKVPVICHSESEDYTAGEIAEAFPVCPGRWVNQAQYHILSYLGERWCGTSPRFPDEFVIGYTQDVVRKGGIVTWDVGSASDGLIHQPLFEQLCALGGSLPG